MVGPVKLLRPPHQLVATVLGAGTMGAQIAAHLANAGIRTFLLDIVPKGVPAEAPAKLRNALGLGAMKVMAKAKPAPFTDKRYAGRITVGNFDDDLERAVAASDLVIEAVVERLDIKQSLFGKVVAAAKPDAILASNTSGIAIGSIADGLPEDARKRLVGMHFFNPPRYMHLLEVVPSAHTAPEVVAELSAFSDRVLGKGVVLCRDTPNFIGNRVGIAEMLLSFKATTDFGLTVEEVDLLNGPLMGRPRTGSYRLGDMVGLDVVGHVVRNLQTALSGQKGEPGYDELYELMVVPPVLEQMFERKMLGDKTRGGFYKKSRDAKGKRVIRALDFESLEYRDKRPPNLPELAEAGQIGKLEDRVAAALRVEGRAGDFLRRVYLTLMNYSANRVGEICDTPRQIDDAMCWGYGWKLGPFGLWDAVGLQWGIDQIRKLGMEPAKAALELLEKHGPNATWYGSGEAGPTVFIPGTGVTPIPVPEGMLLLQNPATRKVLASNKSASLLDLGDGIACVEFHCRKMNVLNDGVMEMLGQALPTLEKTGGFRGLVIGNQADNFCAGADLRGILKWSTEKDFDALTQAVATLQNLLMDLRHAPIPVVVAAQGMALGGGVEVALHGDAIQASSELYMGLVEAGVGLLPAGGGLKELCRRASAWAAQVPGTDPYPFIRRAFDCVGGGKVSSSAAEARAFGFLAGSDRITGHKNRVVADAKQVAIGLAEAGYVPPDRNELIDVIGEPQGVSFLLGAKMFAWGGYISEHDHLIGKKIAHVLSGGMTPTATKVTAQRLLDLEREAFVSLAGEEKTRARIEHMLKTGKPLRN